MTINKKRNSKRVNKKTILEIVVTIMVEDEDFFNFMANEYEEIKSLNIKTPLGKRRCKRVVREICSFFLDTLLDEIIGLVADGYKVHFTNFATFMRSIRTVPKDSNIYLPSDLTTDRVRKKDIYLPKIVAASKFKQMVKFEP